MVFTVHSHCLDIAKDCALPQNISLSWSQQCKEKRRCKWLQFSVIFGIHLQRILPFCIKATLWQYLYPTYADIKVLRLKDIFFYATDGATVLLSHRNEHLKWLLTYQKATLGSKKRECMKRQRTNARTEEKTQHRSFIFKRDWNIAAILKL